MKQYSVGLDIGTASIGWVALTPQNRLMRAKGHELIGVRLFEPADTAQQRRIQRTTRRRIARRRWRIRMLNSIFDAQLSSVDPSFLARRKYSWVHEQDRDNAQHYYGGILFGTADEIASHKDAAFYEQYPTIYHLRQALMQDDFQHDIREVYLAIHHIVKYRGHFLIEGPLQSSKVFNPRDLVDLTLQIISGLTNIDNPNNTSNDTDSALLTSQLHRNILNPKGSKSQRADDIVDALQQIVSSKDNTSKKALLTLAKALVGLTANLDTLFHLEGLTKNDKDQCKINFTDPKIDEKLQTLTESGIFNDEQLALLNSLHEIVQSVQLAQLLGNHQSISEAMCELYDKHKANLHAIRSTVNDCQDSNERAIMRRNIATYYRATILTHINKKELSTEEYKKLKNIAETPSKIKKLSETIQQYIRSSSLDIAVQNALIEDMDNDRIFPVQRSIANGGIPHQLHLNELHRILDKQSKYYPFLNEQVDIAGKPERKIEALMKFRVPYYVGPLVAPEDMASTENSAYHWMRRKSPGVITPWNFEEKVDTEGSAKQFIKRLVGTDTYLLGEETLPQNSLLYQEFNVLNELNNITVSIPDGLGLREPRHLLYEEKQHLIEECFLRHKTVTRKQATAVLSKYASGRDVEIFGLSDSQKFMSSLSSFITLRTILGETFVNDLHHREILEEIIKLQTIFEDRTMLQKQLSRISELGEEYTIQLSNIHYTGWGRLSHKLLTSRIAVEQLSKDILPAKHSIIEIMRDTSKNFMQVITNSKYGIQDWIDKQNNLWLQDQPQPVDDDIQPFIAQLRVSGKVKRGIIQALAVIDDITKAVGNPPTQIFVELADDIQASLRTRSRKSQLSDLYARMFAENSSVKQELSQIKKFLDNTSEAQLRNDRLFLYFLQQGKDVYTGEAIDIDYLSSRYHIDHIIPQAITVDNSIDNRVLVAQLKNAEKSDQPIETQHFPAQARILWKKLLETGLMSRTKYDRLTGGTEYWRQHRGRFIARSLVETRQIMRNVCTILRARYGADNVIGLPSALTTDMRRYLGYNHKNRDINELHHAQDALCIAAAGQFIYRRKWVDREGFTPEATQSFMTYLDKYEQEYRSKLTEHHKTHAQHPQHAFGFVVGSMRSSHESLRVDPDTGEIIWTDADAAYLRRVMNYKTMLITYKSGDNIQSLYKETRHPAKDNTKLIQFDKRHTNTSLYGGFSEEHTACVVLVEDKNVKLLNIIMSEYASYIACKTKSEKLQWLQTNKEVSAKGKLLLDHIPIGQLLEWHKSGATVPALVMIKSASEFNNARQLWLDHTTYNYVDAILTFEEQDALQHYLSTKYNVHDISECLTKVLEELLRISAAYYPSYGITNDNANIAKQKFAQLSFADQRQILNRIITALHYGPSRSDLKQIGLGSAWGRITGSRSGFTLHDQDTFIFQSPSGLFAKRVSVKQLRQQHDSTSDQSASDGTIA